MGRKMGVTPKMGVKVLIKGVSSGDKKLDKKRLDLLGDAVVEYQYKKDSLYLLLELPSDNHEKAKTDSKKR